MLRTHNCGELNKKYIDEKVKLTGWINNIRDKGALIFFTLRDFYGITQVIVTEEHIKQIIRETPRESTILVEGKVILRSDPNPDIATGEIEIVPDNIEVLSKCTELLPFEISKSTETREDIRLKYRFLDLRNPINKDKIILRAKVINSIRTKMTEKNFLEIQTPILTSSSPEGARDYLVPSRLHPGEFYALPQAPQQFKQLLMVSGIDKYFQIAPCFRDEDARADRSPGEFYQLDVEMSFATQEDVFNEVGSVIYEVFKEFTEWKVDPFPFKQIKYKDSLELYGTDKPDLRNPLLITDATNLFKNTSIPFFKDKIIKAIIIENFDKPRKFFDDLTKIMIEHGCKSLYWLKYIKETFTGGISKFIDENLKNTLINELSIIENSAIVFIAEDKKIVNKLTGLLRIELGERLDLIEKNVFKFCWIVDFPMFEENEATEKIEFSHNPFSMPQGGIEALNTKSPLDILAFQYDIVCNGIELSSGAVRNHDPNTMIKAFEIAGYTKDVVETQFPALFNAFKFGTPPHAGIAPGIDRIVMLLADEPNIREVIAFPLNKNAQDLLMGAPSRVRNEQLEEVHIKLNLEDKS